MALDPMHKRAARADLVEELRRDVGYWGFVGHDENLTAAHDGASALEHGAADSVRVGHTIYSVTDGPSESGTSDAAASG